MLKMFLGFEKDFIIHTAPTANRGDQMSVIGIARELSALFNRPMKFEYAKAVDKKQILKLR